VSSGPERRVDLEDGLSDAELTHEAAIELPAREAMSAIGDIAIPLDPDMAADALLGQDMAGEPEDASAG
jgi:hypothetical protein